MPEAISARQPATLLYAIKKIIAKAEGGVKVDGSLGTIFGPVK